MNKIGFLSNNTLKIIACIAMFIDHLGFMVFPETILLRAIGRIAFPIFDYMLAEGAIYTKHKVKILLILSLMGIAMQVFMYFFADFTDLSIFIHFSIALILIYLFDILVNLVKQKRYVIFSLLTIFYVALLFGLYFLTVETSYFFMNYGFFGMIIPLCVFIVKKYVPKYSFILSLLTLSILLIMYVLYTKASINYLLQLGVILLLFYNGKRGKYKLKYFFYLFYPLHFVLIFGIQMLLTYFK